MNSKVSRDGSNNLLVMQQSTREVQTIYSTFKNSYLIYYSVKSHILNNPGKLSKRYIRGKYEIGKVSQDGSNNLHVMLQPTRKAQTIYPTLKNPYLILKSIKSHIINIIRKLNKNFTHENLFFN